MTPTLYTDDAGLRTKPEGGAETMPMTVPFLPIIWVSDGTPRVSVSAWWEQEEHRSSCPLIHQYHEETGELLGSTPANPSPRQPGVWLTPAHATQQNPPPPVHGHVMRFVNGSWTQDPQLFTERLADRQKTELKDKKAREARDQAAMILSKKIDLMDKWASANGAPYTLSEILKDMK